MLITSCGGKIQLVRVYRGDLLFLCAVCGPEDLVDIRRGRVTPVSRVIEVPVIGLTVEDGDVLVATARQPKGRAEAEDAGTDDDNARVWSRHFAQYQLYSQDRQGCMLELP